MSSMPRAFGEYFKEKRIALGKTLREFCGEHAFDAGNTSKLERGLLAPPQAKEKLEAYAKALKLSKGTPDWQQFFDLAAAAAGVIPEDLRDENVLKRLPLVFRTLRATKLSEQQLDKLVERLRKE